MNCAVPINPSAEPFDDVDGWPSPLAIFRLRAWARAYLARCHMMTLTDAVDELQADAEESGLVNELGLDRVQEILAENFGAAP
jgi:hypothetical protein